MQNMQALLGDEYPAFLEASLAAATAGLRANTLKTSPYDLSARLPYALSPVAWCPAGFQLPAEAGSPSPGRHPYHAAGLYYLQEPSAMAAAELLDPQPGERILDLCAAPGGKSTHLAARLGGEGLLVANETHPKRVWELAENLERWGARNVVITHESPARLAENLADFFDRVLVDAPCSGEGMFRKSEAARQDWSPDLVRSCALRQASILESGARLTRPGGLLGYSTCTFNPQENEQTLAYFLRLRPDFELVQKDLAPKMSPGRPEWAASANPPPLERAARLWPHLIPGEGHFVAVMRRGVTGSRSAGKPRPPKSTRKPGKNVLPPGEAHKALDRFCQAHLHLSTQSVFSKERLARLGDQLYLIPPGAPELESLRAIRPGWWLGQIHTGKALREARFEPSHALALGLKAEDARQVLDIEAASAQTLGYLRGEVLDWTGEDGWVLVCVDGYPLGWGRGVQGKLKNHYPRGLRWV
jgi:NOL1/NOP2/sun family putative RNA methylase